MTFDLDRCDCDVQAGRGILPSEHVLFSMVADDQEH